MSAEYDPFSNPMDNNQSDNAQLDEPKQPMKASTKVLIAIAIVVLLAAIITLIVLFIPKHKSTTKELVLTLKGSSGTERFKLLVDGTTLIDDTQLTTTDVLYRKTIPIGAKTIVFTFINDAPANDIFISGFTIDNVNVLPLVVFQAVLTDDRIAKYRIGQFCWGGNYTITL